MIIVRAPLRITLGGGGTDLPNYYREHGGFCVSAAIDKHIYVVIHETFAPGITLKYSKVEHVTTVDEIEHPIIREALRMMDIRNPHLAISSHADIPAGTGLGSSSSFTVALLKALYAYRGIEHCSPASIAGQACEIEINRLGGRIGRQDQTIAAYGGVQALTFCPDDTVETETLGPRAFLDDFARDLLMFYTGRTHVASEAMQAQGVDNWGDVRKSGYAAAKAIGETDRNELVAQLNRQWQLKLERDPALDPQIIEWQQLGLNNGANAGKLIGAGRGGFLLFYAYNKLKLRSAMFKAGLRETRFKFFWDGAKVIVS